MTQLPEALRLADLLDRYYEHRGPADEKKAAAELRRLHELRLEDAQRIADIHAENHRLADINAQLLEALAVAALRFSYLAAHDDSERNGVKPSVGEAEARTAIAAAKEKV